MPSSRFASFSTVTRYKFYVGTAVSSYTFVGYWA